MSSKSGAEEIYRLIYGAVTADVPNFGGHVGVHGMMRGLREDLMKQTAIFCSKMREDKLSEEEINAYLAMCNTAVATEVLAKSDLEIIIKAVESNT